jgi:hypothetical protein
VSRAQTLAKARAASRRKLQTTASPGTGPFLTGKKLKTVLCILLGAATIALYSPVIGHSFVVWTIKNTSLQIRHIQSGAAWSTIKWAFTSTYAANWHPLTWLSHALDYQLFGLNPAGHHFDSVLIHALNAVLLFLLLGMDDQARGAEPAGGGAVRRASAQRGVGGVGGGAKERSEHVVLFLAIGAYVLVRAETRLAAISAGGGCCLLRD